MNKAGGVELGPASTAQAEANDALSVAVTFGLSSAVEQDVTGAGIEPVALQGQEGKTADQEVDVGEPGVAEDGVVALNRKAEDLWGLPDASGRYLTRVVVHGDDMSEEDYSKLGNHLLGALNRAAGEYGYERRSWDLYKAIMGSYSDDPLVAELPDGTIIAASSTSRRGPGWRQDSRRPTPQEHARWAGLPIPPEPPPPAQPPPTISDVIWDRVAKHAGETFTRIRGGEFTYSAHDWYLWILRGTRGNASLSLYDLNAAVDVWPVAGPSGLPNRCERMKSYIWALLADERILGLRDPGTGAYGIGSGTGADPSTAAPEWLIGPKLPESFVPVRIEEFFDPTPDRWGLRGDPFLWEALRARFASTAAPASATELRAILLDAFQEFVGVDPFDQNAPESVYMDRFARGGMSSGHVHLATWRDHLLPTIVGRGIGRVG